MKNFILLTSMTLFSIVATAQEVMKIEKVDGTTIKYDVSDINRVYFANEENESTETTKRLVRIDVTEVEGSYYEHDLFILKYDSEGRLDSYDRSGNEVNYTYRDGVFYEEYDNKEKYSYYLLGDKISHGIYSSSENFSFSYDAAGKLERFTIEEGSYFDYQKYTWSGNQLTEAFFTEANQEGKWSRSFTYDRKTCEGYNPVLVMYGLEDDIDEIMPIIAKPELAGFMTNELPVSMNEVVEEEEADTLNFTYELGADGYLIFCRAQWTDSEDAYTEYRFIWE